MLIIVLGVLVGLLLGLTGAGGGILAIPALTLGLGWSLLEATPVALLAVGIAAAVGALDGLRKGL
ncbi:TSUP family transporter, partial [Pseudomonas fragi]|nr:TSUP family transporter [Pseudomonas sp. GC01]